MRLQNAPFPRNAGFPESEAQSPPKSRVVIGVCRIFCDIVEHGESRAEAVTEAPVIPSADPKQWGPRALWRVDEQSGLVVDVLPLGVGENPCNQPLACKDTATIDLVVDVAEALLEPLEIVGSANAHHEVLVHAVSDLGCGSQEGVGAQLQCARPAERQPFFETAFCEFAVVDPGDVTLAFFRIEPPLALGVACP